MPVLILAAIALLVAGGVFALTQRAYVLACACLAAALVTASVWGGVEL